jgi:hypothetical protein
MQRRELFAAGGQTLIFTLAARATGSTGFSALSVQQPSQDSRDTLEQRLAAVIQAYDAQGNHRTGTEVDTASAQWLAEEVRRLGVKPSLEPFTLNRVDPQSCYLRIGSRRIDGVPLFDAGFTDGQGVRGKLGFVGSDAAIGLLEIGPFKLAVPRAEHQGAISTVRRSPHRGVVLLARGKRPGLFLSNALAFRNPSGPPMLQVSNAESEWLKEQLQVQAEATLVVQAIRTAAQAFNVTAKIPGSNPKLAPLVFMAPRSAWWQCVSEQGCRVACWLEIMRALAAAKPARDCLFVAFSGHELGVLGTAAYIEMRPDLIWRAHTWIFLGSSIGAPRQPNLIHASDEALEGWITSAIEKEGLTVDERAPRNSPARGEALVIQQGGGRFVTVACDSEVYHSVADRWPDAVDVAALARYAKAFVNGALQLAQQSK